MVMGRGQVFSPARGQSPAQVQALIDAQLVAVSPYDIPGWIAGRYYGNDTQGAVASFSTAVVTANFLVAVWCAMPPEGAAIDRIGAEVTTGVAAKHFRVAAYQANGTRRYPGSLILESAELSAASIAWVEDTVAATLPGGGVWLVFQTDDSTVVWRHVAASARIAVVGKAAGGGTVTNGSLVVARSYGAFPATFPAGATPGTSVPVVNVRAA